MFDILHKWGMDLVAGSGGDLAVSGSADAVSQRVYRRLLTNPGDYLWNLDFGGGLAQFVGSPADTASIEAAVRVQLALETAIPTTPAPRIIVRVVDAANGYILMNITYTDPSSNVPVSLNVSTG